MHLRHLSNLSSIFIPCFISWLRSCGFSELWYFCQGFQRTFRFYEVVFKQCLRFKVLFQRTLVD